MTTKTTATIDLSVFWRALFVLPVMIIVCIALTILLAFAFGEAGNSRNWLIDAIKEGGGYGLTVGGITYAIVVVLRLSTQRCQTVVQEMFFMFAGASLGWMVGSRFSLSISFPAVFGLILGTLLGALFKRLTDSKPG